MLARSSRCRRSRIVRALLVALILTAPAFAGSEEEQDHKNLAKALQDGDWWLSLRYRYAFIDEDTYDLDGQASTLRTAAGYRSAGFYGLKMMIEFEDVTDLGAEDRHNTLVNGVSDRPIEPDPAGTDVNQVWLAYGGLDDTVFRIGREEVNLDDQRYVGAVGWRQNHQSIDGAAFTQKSIPRTDLEYHFLHDVQTVIGASRGLVGHTLNVEIDAGSGGKVQPYYYYLDFEGAGNLKFSSQSFGAAWTNTWKAGSWKLPMRVEAAKQKGLGANDDLDADYLRITLDARPRRCLFGLGVEVLGGSADQGQFNTTLATLHKFNGWADRFLVTPTGGLVDLFARLGWFGERFSAILIYHDFSADSEGGDYGQEIDGELKYKAKWKQYFALRFASFDAVEGFSRDVKKVWAYTGYQW